MNPTTTLTHANTKVQIEIALPLIFAAYYSEASKCTHVLATGGAIVPVLESPDFVKQHIKRYYADGGENHG